MTLSRLFPLISIPNVVQSRPAVPAGTTGQVTVSATRTGPEYYAAATTRNMQFAENVATSDIAATSTGTVASMTDGSVAVTVGITTSIDAVVS